MRPLVLLPNMEQDNSLFVLSFRNIYGSIQKLEGGVLMATRRDSKHRVLRRGESIRPDGKYQMQPKSEMAWVCLWLYIT